MNLTNLSALGLTKGELKIYEALLELGETTRTKLAKQSGVSPSKIYDVANKLINKGIISVVKKNGVQHFKAANPERLKDFLAIKQAELDQENKLIDQLLPSLLSKYNIHQEQVDVEVFYGWDGMKTAFNDLIKSLNKGDFNYVYGAGQGLDSSQADIFFSQYYLRKKKKGFGTKIIFNENLRNNPRRIKLFKEAPNQMRFLDQTTFAEINTYKDTVLFILLLKQPLVIRVKSIEAANSCKEFFNTLWNISKI